MNDKHEGLHFKGLRLQYIDHQLDDAIDLLQRTIERIAEAHPDYDVGDLEDVALLVGSALMSANGEQTCEDILHIELEAVSK